MLEAEGPLDDETDCSDVELIPRRDSAELRSATSSMDTESGSPMVIEDL